MGKLFFGMLMNLAKTILQWFGYPIYCDGSKAKAFNEVKLWGNSIQSDVPEGYTQLEYIESTGSQYIDTGFKANTTTTRFVGAFTPKDISGIVGVFGSRHGTIADTSSCNIFIISNKFRLDWASGSSLLASDSLTVGTKYAIDITRPTVVVNDTTYTGANTDSIDQDYNFYIGNFANGSNTPFSAGFIGYIYPCQLYSNGTLVRNFIPAKRNSDGVAGMYDTVTQTFYTSATSTAFVAGSEATPSPSSPIAIESVGDKTKNLFDYVGFYDNYQTYNTSKVGRYPIKLEPNTQYTVSTNAQYVDEEGVKSVAFAVGGGDISWAPSSYSNGPNASTPRTVTSDSDGYICVGIYYTGKEQYISKELFASGDCWLQIEEGSTATDYEPYGYNVPIVCSGKNLFDSADMTIGENIAADGSVVTSSITNHSNYIPVQPNTTYTITDYASGSSSSAVITRYHAYSSSQTWLSQITTHTATTTGTFTQTFTTPNDCYYVRFTTRQALNNKIVQLEQGSTATTYQEYHEPVTTNCVISAPLRKVGTYADTITCTPLGDNLWSQQNWYDSTSAPEDMGTDIAIDPTKNYVLSYDFSSDYVAIDENNIFISLRAEGAGKNNIFFNGNALNNVISVPTAGNRGAYYLTGYDTIRIYAKGSVGITSGKIYNFCLEEVNSKPTTVPAYVPYGPVATVTRNLGYNGLAEQTWTYESQYTRFYYVPSLPVKLVSEARVLPMLSNEFTCITDKRDVKSVPNYGFYAGKNDTNIYFKTTDVSTVDDFVALVKEGNVIYPLKTPTTETYALSNTIDCFDRYTKVTVDTTIEPSDASAEQES